jgi:adenylate cyclase
MDSAYKNKQAAMSFIDELKRRNVIRVAITYLVASWLLLQIVDVLTDILDLPGTAGKFVFFMLVVGLVPTLIFSWVYEMTPEGLKRDSEIGSDQSTSDFTTRRLERITIILLVVVAGIIVVDRLIPETGDQAAARSNELPNNAENARATDPQQSTSVPGESSAAAGGRQSVAVLPFVNMSDDASNEYFSDGISEELLNVLVRVQSLRVPSRTSSFTYKGSDKKLSEIGRELGVEHLLEGSVRKDGNRIRVTAQLIDVNTDTHIWSETYTRELDDIFAIQEEIANAIAVALRLTLSSTDRDRLATHSTTSVEAYNEYLIGRHFWNKRTSESFRVAIEHLKAAVALDANYDEAWVALAETYIVMPDYYAGSPEEILPLARAALEKALTINPDSAGALAVSGTIKGAYYYDWAGANSDLQRAVARAPGNAFIHQMYGETLIIQRRLDEALWQLQLARELDPLSVVVRHAPGYFLLWSLRLDEAELHYQDALTLGGTRWTIHNLDILHTLRGEYDEARRRVRQLAEMEGFDPTADLARIDAIENPALKDHALELLRQRQDIGDTVFGKALQYALLEEYDLALESLETAFAAGDSYSASMNYVRVYDPLRNNPRFQTMLEEMNLLP